MYGKCKYNFIRKSQALPQSNCTIIRFQPAMYESSSCFIFLLMSLKIFYFLCFVLFSFYLSSFPGVLSVGMLWDLYWEGFFVEDSSVPLPVVLEWKANIAASEISGCSSFCTFWGLRDHNVLIFWSLPGTLVHVPVPSLYLLQLRKPKKMFWIVSSHECSGYYAREEI